MELAIRVGERDLVEAGRLEAGPQRRAVATVLGVAQQPHPGPAAGHFLHCCRRTVAAAVVHDQDFVMPPQPGEGVVRLGNRLADACFFVVGGDDQGKTPAGRPSVAVSFRHGISPPPSLGQRRAWKNRTMPAGCQGDRRA